MEMARRVEELAEETLAHLCANNGIIRDSAEGTPPRPSATLETGMAVAVGLLQEAEKHLHEVNRQIGDLYEQLGR